jgi:anaphase-promoting complex subunit 10
VTGEAVHWTPEELASAALSHREVGDMAVWTLSSAKPGSGVDQLRDDNLTTFWQSDGVQPHEINIQFCKRMKLSTIALYADAKIDESYTPSKLSIRVGNSFHDLRELMIVELVDTAGWVAIQLGQKGSFIRTTFVQVVILSNLQNGRDTHVRQVKVFSPRASGDTFSTPEFIHYGLR